MITGPAARAGLDLRARTARPHPGRHGHRPGFPGAAGLRPARAVRGESARRTAYAHGIRRLRRRARRHQPARGGHLRTPAGGGAERCSAASSASWSRSTSAAWPRAGASRGRISRRRPRRRAGRRLHRRAAARHRSKPRRGGGGGGGARGPAARMATPEEPGSPRSRTTCASGVRWKPPLPNGSAAGRDATHLWPHERLVLARAGARTARHRSDESGRAGEVLCPARGRALARGAGAAETRHYRRAEIGDRLDRIGDPRPGVGLLPDGLPDIVWCEVPGGTVNAGGGRGQLRSRRASSIAKYPVTYRQYKAFLDDADGYRSEALVEGLEARSGAGRAVPADRQLPGRERLLVRRGRILPLAQCAARPRGAAADGMGVAAGSDRRQRRLRIPLGTRVDRRVAPTPLKVA